MAADYVELHCHSAYSFLDGVAHPEELVDRACSLDYGALALTDHDNLCAALPFAHAATAAGLQAITGCELTVDVDGELRHLVLLVESRTGYANLCRLVTAAHAGTRSADGTVARAPQVRLEHVLSHAEGLTCLTGCPDHGVLRSSDPLVARTRRDRLLEAFGEHLVIELQRPFRQGAEQQLRAFERLARERQLPIVATNDAVLMIEPLPWRCM